MTAQKGKREITIELNSKPGTTPTKEDVEQAIHRKLQNEATDLFVNGDTVVLTVKNFEGQR